MEPLKLDPPTIALIVIDLQRGIMGRPVEPHPAPAVLARAVQLAEACRVARALVVLVRVTPSPDGRDRLTPRSDQPLAAAGPLPPDYAELAPQLAPSPAI